MVFVTQPFYAARDSARMPHDRHLAAAPDHIMQTFGFLKFRRFLHVLRVLLIYGLRRLGPERRTGRGPQVLRQFLEDLGGTYIKFGQVLSLQPDALPMAYCNALFDLLDRVPAFPYAQVESTFMEDLGTSPVGLFDSFDPVPIASASIGQVHVAYLGGRRLAVKVRRPTVGSDFAADILMMRTFAALIELLVLKRWYWLARAAREFCTWTHEELDYRYEARFMGALGHNAMDNPREKVPEILDRFTSARILVTDFMQGPMVLDYIRNLDEPDPELESRLKELGFDHRTFARNLVNNFVSDAFKHGLFHADLHPANLFILRDNTVGYVDFGITGSLSNHSRRSIVSLTLAITQADLDGMMDHFLGIADIQDDSDIQAYRRGLEGLLDKWYDPDELQPKFRINFSILLMDMLHLSRQTNLWPTQDVIRYLRSVITADGLITRFAPEMDLGGELNPVCKDYLQERVWREWLAPENLADLGIEGLDLLKRGPQAMTHTLAGEASEFPVRAPAPLARQTLQYAIIALVSGWLAYAGPHSSLQHAAIVVSSAAIGLMLRCLYRRIYLR